MEQTSSVVPFAFEDHLVRVVMRDGEPWFVATDICRVLGTRDASEAVEKLDDDEKGTDSIRTLGGSQSVRIVSESGLYTIVLRSRSATTPGAPAHRFRKWVTGEVLPQIRKTGRYEADAARPAMPDLLPGHPEFPHAVRLVREARLAHGPRAAMALWRSLGLPWVCELDALPDVGGAGFGPELSRFIAECVVPARGVDVTARTLYRAYVAWAAAAGRRPVSETRFGRDAKGHLEHAASSRNVMVYRNIRLANLPAPEGAA
ncbi:Bro-N domain-containing protein [Paracoccus sp. (in: a-proteobacteria)]|uniref:BRO-N domain-containing protein n=1 Tax=Paracoccus sp. TaxID=267 RepID=UPI002AFF76D8|nr:Bro-N domain-containing protein [Paracoccus sp. (in: a-proteobacteria)]